MKLFIMLFAALVILMASALIFRPEKLTQYLLRHAGETWVQVMAVGIRVAIGIVLILYAAQSRFPLTLEIIGWIAIAAGVALALMPPAKFRQMIHWAFERFGKYTRVAAVAALLFGVFLVYAVA